MFHASLELYPSVSASQVLGLKSQVPSHLTLIPCQDTLDLILEYARGFWNQSPPQIPRGDYIHLYQ
jgi:hypothetical protein